MSKIPLGEACSKSTQNFEQLDKDASDLGCTSLEKSECVDSKLFDLKSNNQKKKKISRANAFQSQGSK